MNVSIEFCLQWNYTAQAAGLAAELQAAFPDVAIERIEGSGGRFEIQVDGQLIFSKAKLGRFPAYQEIPMKIMEAAL